MAPTTLEDDASVAALGPLVQHAVEIIGAVEEHTASHEVGLGRDVLVRTINDIDADVAHNHIDEYRYKIIRNNVWPNVERPQVGDTAFITQFGLAASAYIDSAFTAARWLRDRDSHTLVHAHRSVLISEALRGQLGKSSPDGLDVRLDNAIDELLEYLDDEDDIYTACSTSAAKKPAEIAMVADFDAVRTEFTTMPDEATLVTLPPTSATWVFFRRYCRWRMDRFAELWEKLAHLTVPTVDDALVNAERVALLAGLPASALQLADYISALNILNLSLEPTFSFKGGPGLLHAEVFRAAAPLASTPALRQLVLDRNDLLAHIQSVNNSKEN